MKLAANSSTVGEFREVKTLLAAHRKRLQEQLEMYPLVVTFAEYRYVLENMEEYESLISDINEAIVEHTTQENTDMTHILLRCEPAQHNYQPRYDNRLSEHAAKRPRARDFWQTVVQENIPLDQIYVHDICTQCGHIIKRG